MVPRERQQLLCHRSCRRGAHLTGNSEVIHNREPSWETSLDSLRNQAITLKTPSPGVNEFYKKGCQEKSSPSTGGREDFVSSCSATESFHLMFAQGTREAWAQNAQFNLNLSSSPHCE